MLYSYACTGCGWVGNRISKIADRDEQYCDQVVDVIFVTDEDGTEHAAGTSDLCGVKLTREEIPGNARMTTQWGQWHG